MTDSALFQSVALLLGHPEQDWPDRVRTVRAALARVPLPEAPLLLGFCARTDGTAPLTLAARYVTTFDRSRRRCLYLTYYTDGDTRRRGASLARLKALYRDHGWLPPEDELPDFLPLMLEFAARVPGAGIPLLTSHRPALEALRHALTAHRSPYADLLGAVCARLPGDTAASREAAGRLTRNGPPAESVGLDPFPARPEASERGARR